MPNLLAVWLTDMDVLSFIAGSLSVILIMSIASAYAYVKAGARSDREEATVCGAPEGADGRRV